MSAPAAAQSWSHFLLHLVTTFAVAFTLAVGITKGHVSSDVLWSAVCAGIRAVALLVHDGVPARGTHEEAKP